MFGKVASNRLGFRVRLSATQLGLFMRGQGRAVKNLSWTDLDLTKAGQWPGLVQLGCSLLVAATLFVVLGQLVLEPPQRHLTQLVSAQQNLAASYKRQLVQQQQLAAAVQQLPVVQSAWLAASQQLLTSQEFPLVLQSLHNLAQQAGLEVLAVDLQPEVSTQLYRQLKFRFSLQGEFAGLSAFLQGLAQQQQLLVAEDFKLFAVAGVNPSYLQLDLSISAYMQEAATTSNAESLPRTATTLVAAQRNPFQPAALGFSNSSFNKTAEPDQAEVIPQQQLSSMQLRGVMLQEHKAAAVMLTPEQQFLVVQLDEVLPALNGQIIEVTPQAILIQEQVFTATGWQQQEVWLYLK